MRKSLTQLTTVNGETRVLCARLFCPHLADPVAATAAAGGGDGRTAVPPDPSPLTWPSGRPSERSGLRTRSAHAATRKMVNYA